MMKWFARVCVLCLVGVIVWAVWNSNMHWALVLSTMLFGLGVGVVGIGMTCAEQEAAMPVITNGTNGVHKETVSVEYKEMKAPAESKLVHLLQEASLRFRRQDGHSQTCRGMHCSTHPLIFPSQKNREYCIPYTAYKLESFPDALMCRLCADVVQTTGDAGMMTAIHF
jgi:hypothetical protein